MLLSCRTGFHFCLDTKTKQKSQENFILPPHMPPPARAKFSCPRTFDSAKVLHCAPNIHLLLYWLN